MLIELIGFANAQDLRVVAVKFQGDIKGNLVSNVIGLSTKLTDAQAAQALAHEIAHRYLHHDKENTIDSPNHDEYEEQAKRCSKMLLDFLKFMKGR